MFVGSQPPLSLQVLWGQIYATVDRPKIRLRLRNLDMFNLFPVRLGPFDSNSKYHFHHPIRQVLGQDSLSHQVLLLTGAQNPQLSR